MTYLDDDVMHICFDVDADLIVEAFLHHLMICVARV